jgi:hypothetical protein
MDGGGGRVSVFVPRCACDVRRCHPEGEQRERDCDRHDEYGDAGDYEHVTHWATNTACGVACAVRRDRDVCRVVPVLVVPVRAVRQAGVLFPGG